MFWGLRIVAASSKSTPDTPLGLTETLHRTPIGGVLFTTVKDSAVSAYARNAGVKVKTERLLVIHASSRTVEDITRVTILEKMPTVGARPIVRVLRKR